MQGQVAEIALCLPLRIQLLDQREINASICRASDSRSRASNCAPETQQMFLPVLPELGQEAVVVRGQHFHGGSCSRLPAHDHVRLDRFAGMFQVGARMVHVKANGVELVAFSLGQAVASGGAGIDACR